MPDRNPTIIFVPVNSIRTPDHHRVTSADHVKDLISNIHKHGLLQPIGVRPIHGTPDAYMLIWGKHRLEAMKQLSQTEIACSVLDVDDAQADFISHAENLLRVAQESSDAERLIALKQLGDEYRKRFPETTEHAAAMTGIAKKKAAKQKQAKKGATKPAETGEQEVPVEPEPEDEPEPEKQQSFPEAAAAVLGKSKRSVQRDEQLVRRLTEEGLRALEAEGFKLPQIRQVSKIANDERRMHVINYLIAGKDFDQCLHYGHFGEWPVITVIEAEPSNGDADLNDAQWVELHCAKMLNNPLFRFKDGLYREAALYRKLTEARQQFRSALLALVRSSNPKLILDGPQGWIYRKLAGQSGPSDWLICMECEGTGAKDGSKCRTCFGYAYVIPTELLK